MPALTDAHMLVLAALALSPARTAEDLAERAGVHPTYISLLERERSSISILALERLAKALKVEPWELLHHP